MGSGIQGAGVLLPKAVVPDTQGPVLQQRGGDQWQKAHPYTQRGFTPQRVRGSYQPGISPGEVLDRGLVIPSTSATCLLCNLGHILCVPGDTANTRGAEPSQEPGLGRD